jgi:hypothetical protein
MTPNRPISITSILPDEALPDANWADAFEISTQRRFANMREITRVTIGTSPSWVKRLFKVRNFIVGPFGLKKDGKVDAPRLETRIFVFPILQESEDRIVLGMDDVHLNFRIVIERFAIGDGFRIRVTTLVQWRNIFGMFYIMIITPVHKLIVASAIRQVA